MGSLPSQVLPTPLVEQDDGFTLRLARRPEAVIAEARMVAEVLTAAVRRNGWAQTYGSKEHLYFEAWAFLASTYRVTARVRETRLVQIGDVTGYEAFGEAFHIPSSIVISTADAMCLDDEDNWSSRPKYEYQNKVKTKVADVPVPLFQLRSMAQTRAMSKALRSPFSWIIAMAGYAPRAAEEMTKEDRATNGEAASQGTTNQNPQRQSNGNGETGGRVISDNQAKRIWALGHAANKDKDEIVRLLKHFGFAQAKDVTVDKYEELCAEIQRGDAA